ncbi:hypothetical protein HN587_01540 [Candidatus Woesearchaeota archaeon]|jgi:hypothetical protein|nr:hypothetical protein [Candidatus Woesearchaeota archaeon]
MVNKIIHMIKKSNAKFHLKHICPHCEHHKRETRDMLHDGQCYWNETWQKGKYDKLPAWMGLHNFIRLHFLKKPIKLCIGGKICEADDV